MVTTNAELLFKTGFMKIHFKNLYVFNKISVIILSIVMLGGGTLLAEDVAKSYYFYVVIAICGFLLCFASEIVVSSSAMRILYILGIAVISYVISFRFYMGIDDLSYMRIFNNATRMSLIEYFRANGIEYGYLTLFFVINKFITQDYYIAQIIISSLTFAIFGVAIWKFRNISSPTIMLYLIYTNYYFIIMYAGLTRIFLAVAIALLAIYYVSIKNRKKALLLLAIAATIHISVLFLLLAGVFEMNKEIVYNNWKMVSLVMVFIIPLLMFLVSKYVAPNMTQRYWQYSNIGSIHFRIGDLDIVPYLIFSVLMVKRIEKEYKRIYVIGILLLVLSIIIGVVNSAISLGRLVYFTKLGVPIVGGMICKTKIGDGIKLISMILMISYAYIYMMHTTFLNPLTVQRLYPFIEGF